MRECLDDQEGVDRDVQVEVDPDVQATVDLVVQVVTDLVVQEGEDQDVRVMGLAVHMVQDQANSFAF